MTKSSFIIKNISTLLLCYGTGERLELDSDTSSLNSFGRKSFLVPADEFRRPAWRRNRTQAREI